MKLNKFAKIAILPAAAAGLALSGWAVADVGAAGHASENTTANRARSQAAPHQSGQQHANADAKPATGHRSAPRPRKQARAKRVAARRAQHWVTVRRGESLTAIATANHMTWQAIYATPPNYKRIANPDHLRVGERLRLPDDPKMRAAEFRKKFEAVKRRMRAETHPRPAAPSTGGSGSAGASGGSITAGMSAFEQCVAWRESGDTPTDPAGLFGILPSTWASLGYSGTAGEASVAVQEQAFNKLYAEYGTSPWAPYDGC